MSSSISEASAATLPSAPTIARMQPVCRTTITFCLDAYARYHVTSDGLHGLSCKFMQGYATTRHILVKYAPAKELKQQSGVRVAVERQLEDVPEMVPKVPAPPGSSRLGSKLAIDGKNMDIVHTETDTDVVHMIDVVTTHSMDDNDSKMQPRQAARVAEEALTLQCSVALHFSAYTSSICNRDWWYDGRGAYQVSKARGQPNPPFSGGGCATGRDSAV